MKLIVVCLCLISYVAADISLGSQVPIIAQESEVNPDGSYSYNYETGNGIRGQEQGIGGVRAQGSASWSAPDGTPVDFSYVADENGYRAEGAWIPQPPPIPAAIQRALQYIAANPGPDSNP